jgi:hypothetical protein
MIWAMAEGEAKLPGSTAKGMDAVTMGVLNLESQYHTCRGVK